LRLLLRITHLSAVALSFQFVGSLILIRQATGAQSGEICGHSRLAGQLPVRVGDSVLMPDG
jgi:hypothetical protein